MDLNGDGKHDWKDDAIMYHIVNESDLGKEKNSSNESPNKQNHIPSQPQNQGGQGKGKVSGKAVLVLLSLGYLSVWLPGDIPINSFTGIIGIGAIICLIVCFIGWLNG